MHTLLAVLLFVEMNMSVMSFVRYVQDSPLEQLLSRRHFGLVSWTAGCYMVFVGRTWWGFLVGAVMITVIWLFAYNMDLRKSPRGRWDFAEVLIALVLLVCAMVLCYIPAWILIDSTSMAVTAAVLSAVALWVIYVPLGQRFWARMFMPLKSPRA
jgi:hypothetical protein